MVYVKDRRNPALQERQRVSHAPAPQELQALTAIHFFQAMANPPGGKLFLDAVLA